MLLINSLEYASSKLDYNEEISDVKLVNLENYFAVTRIVSY